MTLTSSGSSTASNKTYITEDSSLVLETLEDGRHHHYLIPSQVTTADRSVLCTEATFLVTIGSDLNWTFNKDCP